MTNFARSLIALTLGIVLGAAGLSLAAVDTSFQAASGGGPRNPGFTFQGDTETGVFQQSAGRLEFSVSGTRVQTLTSGAFHVGVPFIADSTFEAVGAGVFDSTLNVVGNFSVKTNKFTVTASNGNTQVAGTFGSTGAVTHSSTTVLTGAVLSNLIFTDNTYDIGASGATRPRDIFLARNAVIGGTLGVTGAATLSSTTSLGGNATFTSAADRVISVAAIAVEGAGKALTIAAGAATTAIADNLNGGNLSLNAGAKVNAGTAGSILIGAANTSAVTITPATTISGAATFSTTSLHTGVATFSAAIRAADGTVAAPAYSFTSATDLGFYYGGPTQIRFGIGGAQIALLGVGGSNSFAIAGTNGLQFYTGAGPTNVLDIDTSSNVTIEGTLQITGSGTATLNGALTLRETVNLLSRVADATGVTTLKKTELPAGAATTADGAAGNIVAGEYLYKITFVTATGETQAGTASVNLVHADLLKIELTAIPTGSAGIVTARRIYRSSDAGVTYKRVTAGDSIADNTTTTYSDNTNDISGNAAAPASNSTLDARLTITNAGNTTIAGTATIKQLPASGGGANQKVLCVDTATGAIYVSATALDCS